MHADLKYVESLEKEIDELESDKAEFSNMYDVILQECVSNVVMSSYLLSLSDLDALAEFQCLYLHKVKECDCLAQKLSKQTEYVSKEVHTELLQRFAKVGKHSISLEIALQKCKEQTKLVPKTNVLEGLSKPVTTQTLPQIARQAVSNTNALKQGMYGIDNRSTQTRAPQSPQTVRITNPRVSTSTGGRHARVSNPNSLRYGDSVQGNVTINRVYYIECLNHNLFSVGQFCDADLEVAFRKSTCFVRDLQGNDLLIVKRSSFKLKAVPSLKRRLTLLHMDLCGPMRVASINGKKYILVIVDDYSRYTWTLFLCSKDETPEVGTEFLNKTLNAFFKEEGIEHQNSAARTPEQNGVVKRQNHTLVEATRTMLLALKHPLFFWAEAIATACYTQN
nr:hypothetical protein [Tanacetum cinerariifolium]